MKWVIHKIYETYKNKMKGQTHEKKINSGKYLDTEGVLFSASPFASEWSRIGGDYYKVNGMIANIVI